MLRCLRKPAWLLRLASDIPAFGGGQRPDGIPYSRKSSYQNHDPHQLTGEELVSLLQTAKIMPANQSKKIQDDVIKRVQELYSTWDLDRTQLCNLLLKSAVLSHNLISYLKGLVISDLQNPRSPFSHSELVSVLRFVWEGASRDNSLLLGELVKRLTVVQIKRMDLACHSAILLRQVKQYYHISAFSRVYERFKEYILANEDKVGEAEMLDLMNGYCLLKWTEFGFEELLERRIVKLCEGEVKAELSVGMLNYLISLQSMRSAPQSAVKLVAEKIEKGLESGQIRDKLLEFTLLAFAKEGMKLRPQLLETIAASLDLKKVTPLSFLALAKLRADSGAAESYSSLSQLEDFGFSRLFGQHGLLQALVLLPRLPKHQVPEALLQKIVSHLTELGHHREIAKFFNRVHALLCQREVTPRQLQALFPILPQLLDRAFENSVIDPNMKILLWFSNFLETQFEPIIQKRIDAIDFRSLNLWSVMLFDTGRIQDYFRVYRLLWPKISTFTVVHLLRLLTEEASSAEIIYFVEMIMKTSGKVFPGIGKQFALEKVLEIMEKYPFVTRHLQQRISDDLQDIPCIDVYAPKILRLYACIHRLTGTVPCSLEPTLHPLITGRHLTYLANVASHQKWAHDVVQSANWDPSVVQLTLDMSKLEVRELFLNLLQPTMQHNTALLHALSENFGKFLQELPLRTAAQWLLEIAKIDDQRLESMKLNCLENLIKRLIEMPHADYYTKADFLPLFSYISASLKDLDFVVDEVLRAFPSLPLSGKCEAASRLAAVGVDKSEPFTDCINSVMKSDNLTLHYAPKLIESIHHAGLFSIPASKGLIDKYLTLALANNAERLNEIDFAHMSLGVLNHIEFSRWREALAAVDQRFWGELDLLRAYTLACALLIPHRFEAKKEQLCQMISRPLPEPLLNVLKAQGINMRRTNVSFNVFMPNYLPMYKISLWNPHRRSRLPYSDSVNGDLTLLGKIAARDQIKRFVTPTDFPNEAAAKKWLSTIVNSRK